MITLCYLVKEKQHNELNFLLLKKKMMQKIMAQQRSVQLACCIQSLLVYEAVDLQKNMSKPWHLDITIKTDCQAKTKTT